MVYLSLVFQSERDFVTLRSKDMIKKLCLSFVFLVVLSGCSSISLSPAKTAFSIPYAPSFSKGTGTYSAQLYGDHQRIVQLRNGALHDRRNHALGGLFDI